VHGCFGGNRKMPFAAAAFVNTFSYAGTFKTVRLFTMAVWADTTVFPQNGFKEQSTCIFIREPFSKLIDVHFIASFFWFGDDNNSFL
jgi:hypothetical protein